MNPLSLGIDIGLRRAKGSAVQCHKDMYKLFGSKLFVDEGSPSTFENIISARQQATCS